MESTPNTRPPMLYACQPGYGHGHKWSKRKFWAASIDPHGKWAGLNSKFDDYGSSLLADAFNCHWKNALNLQLMGDNVKYFAMMHDDIVPEDFWMDKLLTELEETGADAISAVIALKDGRGLTSTALDDPSDPWEVFRRLTIDEVLELPMTFTAADCKHLLTTSKTPTNPLLLNTGCWVCRFDRPWRFKVHFQIYTKLCFVVAQEYKGANRTYQKWDLIPTDEYEPGMVGAFGNKVMSEDWDFSRQLHRLGCDIRATRKVQASHMGDFPYINYDNWGQERHDVCLRYKWDARWKDMVQVGGWLEEEEAEGLATLAKDKKVLEIGCYCGLSTIWMARTAKLVTSIDTFDGRGTPTPQPTYNIIQNNLKEYGVTDKVTLLKGDTREILPELQKLGKKYDFIYIDGAHDYETVIQDFKESLPLLKSDGLVAFHDFLNPNCPGVRKAVIEIVEQNKTMVVHSLISSKDRIRSEPWGIVVLRRPIGAETNGQQHANENGKSAGTTGKSNAPALTAVG